MADIFLSYSHLDRDKAAALAEVLARHGWTVWWDPHIRHGSTYREVIETELHAAICVVVLWSTSSVGSQWVLDEASEAAARRCLVPASIDGTVAPFGFRQIQTADLSEWSRTASSVELDRLIESLRIMLGRDSAATASPSSSPATGSAALPSVGHSTQWTLFEHLSPKRLAALVAGPIILLGLWLLYQERLKGGPTSPVTSQATPAAQSTTTTQSAPRERYWAQVSFRQADAGNLEAIAVARKEANDAALEVERRIGQKATVRNEKGEDIFYGPQEYFHIEIGPFDLKKDADETWSALRAKGYPDLGLRVEKY